MTSRPVGIARLGPLFGVRAIAEAAGLDGRKVLALLESGAGHSLAPRIAARQIDRVRPPRDLNPGTYALAPERCGFGRGRSTHLRSVGSCRYFLVDHL